MSEHTLTSLKCLLLDDSVIYAEAVSRMLANEPSIELHSAHAGFGDGVRAARKLHPDVILVGGDTPDVASIVEALDTALPEAPVIVLFTSEEPELGRECVLAGAQLCLYRLDDQEELIASMRRLVARERRRRQQVLATATSEKKPARVIAFHGAKGGSGTTTITINAAVALATLSKKRVIVIDASVQSGDVGVLLDIDHAATMIDLLPHMKDLDYDLIRDVMATHESGVQVLLAPTDLERAELVTNEHFSKILGVLRKNADYVLIDTPPVLDTVSMTALDAADQVVLVATPEVPALRNTARFMQLAAKLGYPSEKLFLLLNRAGSKGAVRNEDIKTHLKHEIGLQIPSVGSSLVQAGNKGVPVALNRKRFGPAKAFRQLAVILDSGERAAKQKQRDRKAGWLKLSRSSAKSKADNVVVG